MSETGSRPLPNIQGPERPFWEALRNHEVHVQRCACGHYRFPASRNCPVCHSADFTWISVEPHGEVESYCVFHKRYFAGLDVPYAVAQVRLACGVRFFANLPQVPISDIRIGMKVTAMFERVSDDVTLLQFRPMENAQ